jgi:S-adenosylmethionine synthetase
MLGKPEYFIIFSGFPLIVIPIGIFLSATYLTPCSGIRSSTIEVFHMAKTVFMTSESVTEGHPDKICDQISDAILDEALRQDPASRVAIECLTTTGSLHVAGEMTTKAYVDVHKIVRETLRDIGYTDPEFGIDYDDAGVWTAIHEQSPDISQGVSRSQEQRFEQGAGDQGLMYGFACDETKELMPLTISLAHKLTARLAEVRKKGLISGLGPDGKSQVSVRYVDGKPDKLTAVVIAQQHKESVDEARLRAEIKEKVIIPICGDWLDSSTLYHINATGRFVLGGPAADTGLTGRKIIVDTYGGIGRHGGGAFSGKDPSKVDRCAAYMARYAAKNVVAAGLAKRCEIQVSYSIGVAKPTSINVETFGTGKVDEERIAKAVQQVFDFRPRAIIETLDLLRPIYKATAAYGHFGRSGFPWEKTDKVEQLKALCR